MSRPNNPIYYLLKKFKSSAGDLTYQELADYLKEKVSLNLPLSCPGFHPFILFLRVQNGM